MEYVLKCPLIFDGIKRLDALYLPLESLTSNDTIVIDLSRVKFIKPPAVIGILLTIESVMALPVKNRPEVRILAPDAKAVLEYLVAIDFIAALESIAKWDIPEEDRNVVHTKIRPVIPVTRFGCSADVEQIAEAMLNTFHTEFLGLTMLLQPCHIIFSELADNTLFHAESRGGFVLAQQYNYKAGALLEIAVGDCGIGIARSLRKKPSLAPSITDDSSAIVLAFEDGVSCTCDPHRGYGLGHVQEAVAARERELSIRSGSGFYIMRADGFRQSDSCQLIPGTIAHAVIPCS